MNREIMHRKPVALTEEAVISDHDFSRQERERNGTPSAFSPDRRIIGGAGGGGETREKRGPRTTSERGGKGRSTHPPARIIPR